MNVRVFVIAAGFLLCFGACSSSSSGSDVPGVPDIPVVDALDVPSVDVPPTDVTVPAKQLTFLTFNAGLAFGFVDAADLRQPLIGPAVAARAADVVCLEEVWTQASADAILAATNDVYPYHYLEVTDGGGDGSGAAACTTEDVAPLKTCVDANCAGVAPADLATCALGNCGDEFGALPSDCSTCIAANIGKSIDDILTTCTTASGGSYAYEGRNGLLLLSRFPMSGTGFVKFDSYLNVRVALHAVIAPTGLDPVDVFCTHLTADLAPDVKYAGTYASWGEEQGAQATALVAWIGENAPAVGRTAAVLLGDMNSGPDLPPSIQGVHVENYATFRNAGYADPFAEAAAPVCSWCADNPLVRDGNSEIIDHVLLVRTPDASTATPAREFTDPVILQTVAGPVTSRLSDHYGVSVRLEWP